MKLTSQSSLDTEPHCTVIKEAIHRGETNASIARQFNTTEKSIRRFRKRHNITGPTSERSGISIHNDEATVTGDVSRRPDINDPDAMIRERGLDPLDWILDDLTVNEWEGPSSDSPEPVTYHQAKLRLRRRHPDSGLVPVRSDGWKAPLRTKIDKAKPYTVVILGDQQAPFHDERLNYVFCAWLDHNRPEKGVQLGDGVDLPDVSRHKPDPENNATVNECGQSYYDLNRGYVASSPLTQWEIIPGNHDQRLRDYVINNAPGLIGIKRPDTPEGEGEALLGFRHWLRFDELGINFVEPDGTYEDAQVNLSKYLAVRHGWKAQAGSGSSALKTLEQTGYSIIVGHTHRQSMVYKTKHDIDGTPSTLVGVEAGCMCRMDRKRDKQGRRFPNFTVLPDWQQGFATATIYPDGRFKIDLATYFNGTLLYRDQRFTV